MAVQVNPIAQSLPATTAIQDPATRRFAQAVEDALRALRSEEGAVESLKKAADAMNNAVAGGTPPSIAQWLFSSELYQKLTTEIARVDTQAKQDVLDEALARSQAIQEIQAALAEIESTPAYDPATTYQIGDLVTYDNKLYRAKVETTGNLPTNTTYWDKVGDYASLGGVVAAHTLHLSEIESDITDIGGDLAAEITARDTLATQLRGTYAGTDVDMVSQGLLYSERQARITEDGVTVSNLNALRAQVGVTRAGALTEGFILDEQTIRNTNDLAIVSAVNTALAQITGVSTSISQSGENLIANWTTAQANKWSQIEAEVLTAGGQTIRAALQQEAATRANADGSLGAQWTLKTDINGYISGFGFASTANNATPTSEFIIRADKFAVVMPGYGNHIPFAIGPSGAEFTGLTRWGNVQGKTGFASISQITPSNVTTYIANAAIGNAQIANASITNAKIASATILAANIADGNITDAKIANAAITNAKIGNAAVDTLQIAGNAVTVPVHARATGVSLSLGYVDVLTAPINALGSLVSIFVSITGRKKTEAWRFAVRVLSPSGAVLATYDQNTLLTHSVNLITSSYEAGTYRVQALRGSAGINAYADNVSLFMIGTKR